MRKLLFTAALALFLTNTATAQITTNAGTFNKPAAGDTAFEMQFMPNLDGTAMFAESNSGTLMMRKFKSETKATRLAINLEVADSGIEGSDTAFAIGVGYGIENHFSGAERLSTYWGYQGNLGYADDGTDDLFSVGAGVFLGADYYIVPKVYVGTELGYGLGVVSGDDTSFAFTGSVTGMLRLGFRL